MAFTANQVLSRIGDWIESIAPTTVKVKPFSGSVWCLRRWQEERGGEVVGIHSGVEGWIPEGASVGVVGEEAEGDDVFLFAGGGVHGVGTGGGVDDGLRIGWNTLVL